MNKLSRRPVKARQSRWAATLATWLIQLGMQPNQVSIWGLLFAGLAGTFLILAKTSTDAASIGFLVAAGFLIQLRLLCNLLDGMLAIEGALKTPHGEIYNELPDRLSDVLILVCAGYSVPSPSWAPELGWAAAVVAVMTAYVRTFGGSIGASQYFCGPMAKQARMIVMTLACFAAVIEILTGAKSRAMVVGLALIIVGCVLTIGRRTVFIARELAPK
jgi:phosphatidylglycerophosphate synthase